MPDFAGIELTRLKATPSDESLDKRARRDRRPPARARARRGGSRRREGRGADGRFHRQGGGRGIRRAAPATRHRHRGRRHRLHPGLHRAARGHEARRGARDRGDLPRGLPAKEVAGKPATFEITAKKLRSRWCPPVDEELAKKIGFENLTELQRGAVGPDAARIRPARPPQAQAPAARRARRAGRISRSPQGMVDAEFEQIWQRVQADLKAGGADDEDKQQGRGDAPGRIPRHRRAAGEARPPALRDRPAERHHRDAGRADPGDAGRGRRAIPARSSR